MEFVALPTGIFWTKLGVCELLVWLCATLRERGWLWETINVEILVLINVGEETLLRPSRLCVSVSLESY